MTVLHTSLIPPNTLCGADGEFIDAKYIVRNKWKARLAVFLFGCRECGAELREVMRTKREIQPKAQHQIGLALSVRCGRCGGAMRFFEGRMFCQYCDRNSA